MVLPAGLHQPAGIVRLFEFLLTLVTFSLVASVGHTQLLLLGVVHVLLVLLCCFLLTLLLLLLEFSGLHAKLPVSWEDLSASFAMLATLMLLTCSIIYPRFFACSTCTVPIVASVTSWLSFLLYAAEVGLSRARAQVVSSFLATVPGLMKVLEAFVACIIFISLDRAIYRHFPGLQWCVAVYSICFVVSTLVILLTVCRLLPRIPFAQNILMCFNVLAVLMYLTALVIWPYYCFRNHPRPGGCAGLVCYWDFLLVVAVMTAINLLVYVVDLVYSVRLLFFTS